MHPMILAQSAIDLFLIFLLAILGGGPEAPSSLLEDCNRNGVEDYVDIGFGTSSDENRDGIPDECQLQAPVEAPPGANRG